MEMMKGECVCAIVTENFALCTLIDNSLTQLTLNQRIINVHRAKFSVAI